MLDRLVESKNHDKENRKLNGLFSATMTLAVIGLVFAFVISLYSFELNLGSGELELSSLTAPVIVEEPQPEPPKLQKQQPTETVKTDMPMRVANIQRLEESPVKPPETVAVTPSKNQARPNVPFNIGKIDTTPINPRGAISNRDQDGKENGAGISNDTTSLLDKNDKEEPVIKPPVKKEEPKPKPPIVSGGVVNGKAKYLAQPIYPAAAKQIRAGGRVEVQVLIDETGRVVSASVVSGNPLLRDSALNAARKSTFAPTKLSDVPVKVSGVIVYNFNP